MAAESVGHVRVGSSLPRLPPEPRLAQELGEDPALDVPPPVVAHVDDQAGAVEDRVEVAGPARVVVAPHRPQVDVADLGLPLRLDGEPARELPVAVAQIGRLFRSDRHHDDVPLLAPLGGLDPQQHLLVHLVAQQDAEIGGRQGGNAVDRFDDVPLLDLHARSAQRAGRGRQVGVHAIDVIDPPPPRLLVTHQRGAERSDLDGLTSLAVFAAADEGMQRRQLAHHLPQQVVELGPAGHPQAQGAVLLEHRRPVDAVHLRVVKIVALQAPRLAEHLLPLLPR